MRHSNQICSIKEIGWFLLSRHWIMSTICGKVEILFWNVHQCCTDSNYSLWQEGLKRKYAHSISRQMVFGRISDWKWQNIVLLKKKNFYCPQNQPGASSCFGRAYIHEEETKRTRRIYIFSKIWKAMNAKADVFAHKLSCFCLVFSTQLFLLVSCRFPLQNGISAQCLHPKGSYGARSSQWDAQFCTLKGFSVVTQTTS